MIDTISHILFNFLVVYFHVVLMVIALLHFEKCIFTSKKGYSARSSTYMCQFTSTIYDSEKTIKYDKYRILSHFVGSRIIEYLYLEKEVPFDMDIAKSVLNDYFGEIPYYRYLKIKGRFLEIVHRTGLLSLLKSFRKNVLRRRK